MQFPVYIHVQKTGTHQHFEGALRYHVRQPDSPALPAIWLDDVLSTGSSLVDGVKSLRELYNIRVKAAVFLVDREVDRWPLVSPSPPPPQSASLSSNNHLIDVALRDVRIFSVFSLTEIDDVIHAASHK
jgi:orotate phosphoribosyltransferase